MPLVGTRWSSLVPARSGHAHSSSLIALRDMLGADLIILVLFIGRNDHGGASQGRRVCVCVSIVALDGGKDQLRNYASAI